MLTCTVAAAAEQRLLTQLPPTFPSTSSSTSLTPEPAADPALLARYISTLRVLLLCTARATPTTLSPADDARIRASARRALQRLAVPLSAGWDTDAHAPPLYDLTALLLADAQRAPSQPGGGARGELVPREFLEALEEGVLGKLCAEAAVAGERFWASRYEERVCELRMALEGARGRRRRRQSDPNRTGVAHDPAGGREQCPL